MIESSHPNWKALPVEILHAIFGRVSANQLCYIILVCKAWLYPARTLLYSNVYINNPSQLSMFHDTVKKNTHLGVAVKNLVLERGAASKLVYKYLTPLLYTFLPNLESFQKPNQIFYIPVLDALMDGRLKHLKNLSIPSHGVEKSEIVIYHSCVLQMIDRLENIKIGFLSGFLDGLYSRIFKKLHEFKRLKTIRIHISTWEEIEALEYVAETSQTLKEICFKVYNDNFTLPRNGGVSIDAISTFVPRFNVERLIVEQIDIKTLLYIIHKFPRLHELDLIISNESSDHSFNQQSLTQLLHYFLNISGPVKAKKILADHNTITKSIGAIWDVTPVTENQCVEFIYSQIVSEVSLEYFKSNYHDQNQFVIKYPASNIRWLHTSFVEKNGRFIRAMFLEFDLQDSDISERCVLPENFMTHTLTFCPKLKSLSLNGCTMKSLITHPILSSCDNFSLELLAFEKCCIEQGTLALLSQYVIEIGSLLIYEVSHGLAETQEFRDYLDPLFDVNMPYTKIGRIHFNYGFPRGGGDCWVIVTTTSDNNCYYFKYDSSENNNCREVACQEYDFFACINHYLVTCKTKPIIRFEELGY